MKIIPVDCNYTAPETAAAYLLVENGRGLFVECNANPAIPYLLEAIKREGLHPEQIDGLLITHVHLDHAGGAGMFLKQFPNALLYAHPRAARHAIDPSRLVASAKIVYGEDRFQKLYGEVLPCDASRVRVLEDGDSLPFAGGVLQTFHVRGHANHHLAAFEPLTRTLFTGDTAGVTYSKVNRKHGVVALVSTSPTDFDGEQALLSLDRFSALGAERIAPTHFGFVERADHQALFSSLREQLHHSIALQARVRSEGLTEEAVYEDLKRFTSEHLLRRGIRLDSEDFQVLELDFRINSQGLRVIRGNG